MGATESDEFLRTTNWAISTYERVHIFTAGDICLLHLDWLKEIYIWAGQYRQVIMSKDDFTFAFPAQIPKLMLELVGNCLVDTRLAVPCRLINWWKRWQWFMWSYC
jgi:fido (protein-threonine AMPylation protein)